MNCKDCKHWTESEFIQGGFGICDELGSNEKIDIEICVSEYSDGAGLGNIETTPDFGCVLFEQKTDETKREN